jgi:hypothetical protein
VLIYYEIFCWYFDVTERRRNRGSISGRNKSVSQPQRPVLSGNQSASYPVGTEGSFLREIWRPGSEADHSPQYSDEIMNRWGSSKRLHGVLLHARRQSYILQPNILLRPLRTVPKFHALFHYHCHFIQWVIFTTDTLAAASLNNVRNEQSRHNCSRTPNC